LLLFDNTKHRISKRQVRQIKEIDMDMEQANAVTSIVCDDDTELVVHIRRNRSTAPVWYTYAGGDGSTPFQTADMPMDDQTAARTRACKPQRLDQDTTCPPRLTPSPPPTTC
jgi:hypothetical protein